MANVDVIHILSMVSHDMIQNLSMVSRDIQKLSMVNVVVIQNLSMGSPDSPNTFQFQDSADSLDIWYFEMEATD